MAKYRTVNDLYPDLWLRPDDLPRAVTVTVDRVTIEEIYSTIDRGYDDKAVLSFVGKEKRLILNKTQTFDMAQIAGDEFAGWPGTRVQLAPAVAKNKKPTIKISAAPQRQPAANGQDQAPAPPQEPSEAVQEGQRALQEAREAHGQAVDQDAVQEAQSAVQEDQGDVYAFLKDQVPQFIMEAQSLDLWAKQAFNGVGSAFANAGALESFWDTMAGGWDPMLNGPVYMAAKEYRDQLVEGGLTKADAAGLAKAELENILDSMDYSLEEE